MSIKYNIICINGHSDIYETGVYKLYFNGSENNFYIGSTSVSNGRKGKIGFYKRFSNHVSSLRKNKHRTPQLSKLYNLLGEGELVMKIIELCPPGLCREREQHYIDTLVPSYNKYTSSISGKGYKHSEETRRKQSAARIGKKNTQEVCLKISAALKGKVPKNIHLIHSPECRKKVGYKLRGRRRTSDAALKAIRTPIMQFTKDGLLIKKFACIKDAVNETGTASCSISQCASGKRPSAGGFKWTYQTRLINGA